MASECHLEPIYGLMEPILNETHYHGRWEPEQRRFDVTVQGVFPQPNAHGIIGQSYRDSTVRNGKLDEYGAVSTPELIDSDGNGPEMTTSAQAEEVSTAPTRTTSCSLVFRRLCIFTLPCGHR